MGHLKLVDVIVHLLLPLLTQETAAMVSTFTYGIKEGATSPFLVLVNSAAVVTDLALFFLPSYVLSARIHTVFERRYQRNYDRGVRLVLRIGVFRAACAMAFIMPSVMAMLIVGLLRLPFWRGLAGLFIGSAVYVVIPLALALPLAASLPSFVVPVLQWIAPVLAVVVITTSLFLDRLRATEHNRSNAE